MSRWYYSQQTKKCMHFWYGGCGGNENRFLTEDECFRECVSTGKLTELIVQTSATESENPPKDDSSIKGKDTFTLKLDAGSCSNFSVKWYFNVRSGGCVQFWYGGCDGNSNSHRSVKLMPLSEIMLLDSLNVQIAILFGAISSAEKNIAHV
uniref:BPTI/Kunitz inhibitor domain-containing protein n=1 Tax=Sinocyclocheilus grahami TaxID=75366 RepID=A0A672L1G1_SINGR